MDCTQANEFALAHWLVNGADGGRLIVRCFGGDGILRENAAGDVLASLTTMLWNAPSKSWTGGATMADASLNRRMTVRLGDAVAFAQIGVVGLDGQIELEALRLYGLPEAGPALLCGTPTLPVGQREFVVETSLDLPSLAAGAVHPIDLAAPGARQGDRAEASLASSTRFIELDAFLVEQHGARAGAERLGRRLRPRHRDAVGGGHETADPVTSSSLPPDGGQFTSRYGRWRPAGIGRHRPLRMCSGRDRGGPMPRWPAGQDRPTPPATSCRRPSPSASTPSGPLPAPRRA
jgi:hypothetical protein